MRKFKTKSDACNFLSIDKYLLERYISLVELLPDQIESIEISKPILNEKRNTPYGRALEMWNNMRFRPVHNKYYKGVKVSITKKEFFRWAIPEIKKAMESNMESPSLDRIDPSKGYCSGNLQIVSRSKNSKKQFQDKPENIEYMRKKGKERFGKRVRLELKDGTVKFFDSTRDVDKWANQYDSYSYYRIVGKRPLPAHWKRISYEK